jgi:hypothetical protein
MLEKVCEQCKTGFAVKDTKKGNARRFCGPICSRRWAANNRSEQWKKKASEAKLGEKNPMFGISQTNVNSLKNLNRQGFIGTHTDSSKKKISKALTGIKRSPETRAKMSKAQTYWRPDDPEYLHFKKYTRKVYYWSNKNDLTQLPNHDKRSRDGYHLDHKYSVAEGFKNNVPPTILGNINNLEFLYCRDNCKKNTKCSITLEELYKKVGEDMKINEVVAKKKSKHPMVDAVWKKKVEQESKPKNATKETNQKE